MNFQIVFSKNLRKNKTFIISIVFSLALLYFALKKVQWSDFKNSAAQANVAILVISFFILTISYSLRAIRWRFFFLKTKQIKFSHVFWNVMIGYLGNSYLPARMGDFIRSFYLGQSEKISKSFSIATTFIERIFDTIILILLGLATISFINSSPAWLIQTIWILSIIIFSFILLFLFFNKYLFNLLDKINRRIFKSEKIRIKIYNINQQFFLGLNLLRQKHIIINFLIYSLFIWSIDVLFAYSIGFALNLHFSPLTIILLLVGLGLSSALPSTPGYIGVYQFVSITILALFGFSASQALLYIITFQLVTYITVSIWGVIGLWKLNKIV